MRIPVDVDRVGTKIFPRKQYPFSQLQRTGVVDQHQSYIKSEFRISTAAYFPSTTALRETLRVGKNQRRVLDSWCAHCLGILRVIPLVSMYLLPV